MTDTDQTHADHPITAVIGIVRATTSRLDLDELFSKVGETIRRTDVRDEARQA